MKNPRAWAMFCMGIWLCGMVFVAIVATQNFYTIDRLLSDSTNAVFRQAAGTEQTPTVRELLRFLSSELNRLYFQLWNVVELAVGILALWLVSRIPGAKRATWAVVAMLAVVLFLMVAITPYIVSIGRSLDFVSRDPPPPGLRNFGLLHATYSALTLINLILGSLVAIWIGRSEPHRQL